MIDQWTVSDKAIWCDTLLACAVCCILDFVEAECVRVCVCVEIEFMKLSHSCSSQSTVFPHIIMIMMMMMIIIIIISRCIISIISQLFRSVTVIPLFFRWDVPIPLQSWSLLLAYHSRNIHCLQYSSIIHNIKLK